jgi:hypothetical protein
MPCASIAASTATSGISTPIRAGSTQSACGNANGDGVTNTQLQCGAHVSLASKANSLAGLGQPSVADYRCSRQLLWESKEYNTQHRAPTVGPQAVELSHAHAAQHRQLCLHQQCTQLWHNTRSADQTQLQHTCSLGARALCSFSARQALLHAARCLRPWPPAAAARDPSSGPSAAATAGWPAWRASSACRPATSGLAAAQQTQT